MASQYLIGLEIGTSGAKCILTDGKGTVLASSTAGPTLNGKIAVILGLVVCTVIGLLNRQKAE